MCFEAPKSVSTKTLLLEHDYRRQGYRFKNHFPETVTVTFEKVSSDNHFFTVTGNKSGDCDLGNGNGQINKSTQNIDQERRRKRYFSEK